MKYCGELENPSIFQVLPCMNFYKDGQSRHKIFMAIHGEDNLRFLEVEFLPREEAKAIKSDHDSFVVFLIGTSKKDESSTKKRLERWGPPSLIVMEF